MRAHVYVLALMLYTIGVVVCITRYQELHRSSYSYSHHHQGASYREVATEDARKSLRILLEAETKPLITDLLRIKWDAYQNETRPGSIETVS